MGKDGDEGELEERDEKDEAGEEDKGRHLGVAPSQHTHLHWLRRGSKILRIVSDIIKTSAPSNRCRPDNNDQVWFGIFYLLSLFLAMRNVCVTRKVRVSDDGDTSILCW